jgi:hypothetical protein
MIKKWAKQVGDSSTIDPIDCLSPTYIRAYSSSTGWNGLKVSPHHTMRQITLYLEDEVPTISLIGFFDNPDYSSYSDGSVGLVKLLMEADTVLNELPIDS